MADVNANRDGGKRCVRSRRRLKRELQRGGGRALAGLPGERESTRRRRQDGEQEGEVPRHFAEADDGPDRRDLGRPERRILHRNRHGLGSCGPVEDPAAGIKRVFPDLLCHAEEERIVEVVSPEAV
jgi:hypothetical protein